MQILSHFTFAADVRENLMKSSKLGAEAVPSGTGLGGSKLLSQVSKSLNH